MDLLDLFVRIGVKDDASDEIEQKSSHIKELAAGAGKAAAAGLAVAGGAATAFGVSAVQATQGFDTSMSNVAATMGDKAQQMVTYGDQTATAIELMEQRAKELGSSTQFSASEAADAFGFMALAGWDASQSLGGIDGVLNLAAASGMDLARASDVVTDYLSAFGMEAGQAGELADMMAFAQGNANTSADQLAEAFKNCAASLHAGGQDVQTTTAMLSMMANQGLKGSEAGTALTAIMRDMTAQMKNGKIAIGNTSVEVVDAQGNFRDLTDILADVEAATDGMGDAERAAALSATFTADSTKGLNLLLNAGIGEAAGFEDALRGSAGAAEQMAAVKMDNLQGDLLGLSSAWEGLQIAVGEKMMPTVRDFVEMGTTAISGLTALVNGGTGSAAAAFAALRDRIAGAAEGIGQGLAGAVEGMRARLAGLPDEIAGWLSDNSGALYDKGVELFGQLLVGMATRKLEMAEWLAGFVADVVMWIGDHREELLAKGADIIGGIIEGVTTAASGLYDIFSGLAADVAAWVEAGGVQDLVAKGGDLLQGLLDGITQGRDGDLMTTVQGLPAEIAGFLGDTLTTLTQAGTDLIQGLLDGARGLIDGDLTTELSGLPARLPGMIGDVAQTLAGVGTDLLQGLLDGVDTLIPQLYDFFLTLPSAVVGFVGDTLTALVPAGTDLIQGVLDGATSLFEGDFGTWFTELPGKVVDTVGDTLTTLVDKGGDLLQGLWDGVQQLWPSIEEYFTTMPSVIGQALGDLVGTLTQKGIDLITGLFNGVSENDGELTDFFTNLPQTLLDLIGDVGSFLLNAGGSFIGGFLEGVNQSNPDLIAFFTGLPTALVTLVGDVTQTLLTKGQELLGGLKSGIDQKAQTVTAFFSALPGAIVTTVGDVTSSLLQKGKDILNGLLSGIGSIFSGTGDGTVEGFFKGVKGKVTGWLNELNPVSWLVDVGTNVIQGLVDGITNFNLRDAIIGVFGDVGAAACDALGIQSPSTVMEEIGDFTMQGLENGISKGEGPVDSVLSGIANGLPDNFANAYWAMHDMGSGLATSFQTGMSNTFWGTVVPAVQAMAGAIADNFTAGYSTLWYAGQQIMAGLGDSIVSSFYSSVASKLQAITAAIPLFKGPLDEDRQLLVDNGEAIMAGLMQGIGTGADQLYTMLSDITGDISGAATATVEAQGYGGQTVINMAGMFDGARVTFSNREDMDEFGEQMAWWLGEVMRGGATAYAR